MNLIDNHASGFGSNIQEQVTTQDALGSTITTKESTMSMRYHERKQNARTADQGRLLSSPKFLRLAIPPLPNLARFRSSAMSATSSSLTASPPLPAPPVSSRYPHASWSYSHVRTPAPASTSASMLAISLSLRMGGALAGRSIR